MIYFVENFSFPDFGGFGWTAGAEYAVGQFATGMYAIESATSWQEISDLHESIYKRKPELINSAPTLTKLDNKRVAALGRLIFPGLFFRRPNLYNPPHENARRYTPLEKWEVCVVNMDGDTDWSKVDGDDGEFHEPIGKVFAKLTPDLEGQLWCDWHRYPPKQQTLMQHWAAECEARRAVQPGCPR